ncbi:ABC-2 type transport system permease protein [Micromonospora phaseoli]|uniref:ABC-2 type transport system permease protein n=1 Tax=Micromonospora phaseoli TaxID=1144548 RepID=A0A1H6XV50_9ACTN|nr:ABC transporter permease [Micromonospora phaseoli]PZW02272.1 ABC-2 type transport system permease protein [Micromonospora phaseoli]GIJ75724.1 transport permease protein [Micromonospora phaseoli]SEJ28772.1 ABC-2 type transport system permease protein [Micromonospora phaseoli]
MHAFGQILKTETKLYLRDIPTLVLTVLLPTLVLVVLGLIPTLREPNPDFENQSFITYFTPSLLVISLAMVGVNALPTVLATYRERGILRRLATTPASPLALLAAQLVLSLAGILASAVLLAVVARFAFDTPLPQHPLGFAAALILGTAALLALGLLVAAVAPTAKAAQAMAIPVFMVIMFFGGVYLPRVLLPDFLAEIGAYTPPGIQALLDAWTGTAPQPLHLGIMAVIAVAAGAGAAKLFRWE